MNDTFETEEYFEDDVKSFESEFNKKPNEISFEQDEYIDPMNLAHAISREAYEKNSFQDAEVEFAAEDDFDDEMEFEELYNDELESEKLLENEVVGIKEPLAIPINRAVPFAAAPPAGSYWPLISNHKKRKVVSFRYLEKPRRYIGNRSRSFLARRSNGKRYHAGIDLYANHKDRVVACEDGVILNFYHFYRSTYALIVEHENVVINYGEVHKDSLKANGLKKGDRVNAGQIIGFAGKMFRSSMLHFEIYRKGTNHNLRWLKKDKAPFNLLNPTKYLLFLKEQGKIANSRDTRINGAASGGASHGGRSSWSDAIQKGKDTISDIFSKGKLMSIAIANMSKGEKDQNKITNAVFFAKYPSRVGQKLKRNDPLVSDWLSIRNNIVRPLLKDPKNSRTTYPASSLGHTKSTSSFSEVKKRGGGWGGWKGKSSVGTTRITSNLINDDFDIALAVASSIEGSFDKVNMYDKGILSWGIKQWTVHAGSLQGLLTFIKKRLHEKSQFHLWGKLFSGLDVVEKTLKHNGIKYPTSNQSGLMKLFRGNASKVRPNESTLNHWLDVFAVAGRNSVIQELQFEYAKIKLENLMNRKLGNTISNLRKCSSTNKGWCKTIRSFKGFDSNNYGRIGDYLEGKRKAIALFNGMHTQNPAWTYIYLKRAIDTMISRHGSANTNQWPMNWQDELEIVLENLLTISGVATWGTEGVKRYAKKHPNKKPRQSRSSKLLAAYSKFSSYVRA